MHRCAVSRVTFTGAYGEVACDRGCDRSTVRLWACIVCTFSIISESGRLETKFFPKDMVRDSFLRCRDRHCGYTFSHAFEGQT